MLHQRQRSGIESRAQPHQRGQRQQRQAVARRPAEGEKQSLPKRPFL